MGLINIYPTDISGMSMDDQKTNDCKMKKTIRIETT